MRHSIVLAAAAAVALAAAGAHAEQRHMSTQGLDLSSPADAKVFYDRLKTAAADACGGAPTYYLSSQEEVFQACFKATLNDAVAQTKAPLVVAMHGKTPGVQLAAAR